MFLIDKRAAYTTVWKNYINCTLKNLKHSIVKYEKLFYQMKFKRDDLASATWKQMFCSSKISSRQKLEMFCIDKPK